MFETSNAFQHESSHLNIHGNLGEFLTSSAVKRSVSGTCILWFLFMNMWLKMQFSHLLMFNSFMANVKFRKPQEVKSTGMLRSAKTLFLLSYCNCVPEDIYIMLNFASESKGSVPMRF